MADEKPLKSTTPIPVPVPPGSTPSTSTEAAASAQPAGAAAATPSVVESAEKDVAMTDAPSAANSSHSNTGEQAPQSPAPVATTTATTTTATTTTNAPSPAPPARTGTPLRNTTASATTNGAEGGANGGSRAASQHPDQGFMMPAEAPPHGAPVRQYLNSNVTGVLLEGLKALAKDRPKDPLRVLGEFLLQRSKELETSP